MLDGSFLDICSSWTYSNSVCFFSVCISSFYLYPSCLFSYIYNRPTGPIITLKDPLPAFPESTNKKAITQIDIRLEDGQQIKTRFPIVCTVEDILNWIQTAVAKLENSPKDVKFQLWTRVPKYQLKLEDTIVTAQLLNGSVERVMQIT